MPSFNSNRIETDFKFDNLALISLVLSPKYFKVTMQWQIFWIDASS